MTTATRKTSFAADEWYLLPDGWVLCPYASLSEFNEHLVPVVPRIDSDRHTCMAVAPMEHLRLLHFSYGCSRPSGHGGRHAAQVHRDDDGTIRVIAVWSSTEATEPMEMGDAL